APADRDVGTIDGYGSDAAAVQALSASLVDGAQTVHPRLALTRGEVAWFVRHEMARTVEDVLARRCRALLLDARAAAEAAPAVAQLLATALGHDDNWVAGQVQAFQALARGYDFLAPESTAKG